MVRKPPNWLELRRHGIGGRDIGAIALLNPYVTPQQVYEEKLGIREPEPQSEAGQVGLDLEPMLVKWYAEITDTDRSRIYSPGFLANRVYPWMIGTPDRLIRKSGKGLELKVSRFGANYGDSGTDQVPPDVLAQCTWYMGLANRKEWDVLCFIGGQERRLYHLSLDPDLLRILYNAGLQFRTAIEAGNLPEPDHRTLDYLTSIGKIQVDEKPSTRTNWQRIAKDLNASPELIAKHTIHTERTIRVVPTGNRDALETADLSAL